MIFIILKKQKLKILSKTYAMNKIPILLFLIFLTGVCQAQQTKIDYYDSPGNAYHITKTTIQYVAMTPMESSSGTYDGGENKTIKINPQQFATIKSFAYKLKMDKANQTTERLKGNGAIAINKLDFQIKMKSVLKKRFEEYLNKLLSN